MTPALHIIACSLAAACGSPLEPDRPTVLPALVAESPDDCRQVTFVLSPPSAARGEFPDTSCRNGIKLISAGLMTWDGPARRILRIPVRYLNLAGIAIKLPITVGLPVDGKIPLAPPRTRPSTIDVVNADSTEPGGRAIWRIGGTGVLAPGDTTPADTLVFSIHPPLAQARLVFDHEAEASMPTVPLQAPTFKPGWFGDDSSWTDGGEILKRVLSVAFLPGTPQVQREAAIASVRGEVVGGSGRDQDGREGSYYVLIRWAFEVDSLARAIAILEAQPGVDFAVVLSRVRTLGRHPNDGVGWKPKDWSFHPDSSGGDNWVLEDIAASLAWGCETGQPNIKVGIVDKWFRAGDFSANVVGGIQGRLGLDTLPHGTYMGSILGAVGNNSVGMAGILWSSGLLLEATGDSADQSDVAARLDTLIQRGARIISLSLGARFSVGRGATQRDRLNSTGWVNLPHYEERHANRPHHDPRGSRRSLLQDSGELHPVFGPGRSPPESPDSRRYTTRRHVR